MPSVFPYKDLVYSDIQGVELFITDRDGDVFGFAFQHHDVANHADPSIIKLPWSGFSLAVANSEYNIPCWEDDFYHHTMTLCGVFLRATLEEIYGAAEDIVRLLILERAADLARERINNKRQGLWYV